MAQRIRTIEVAAAENGDPRIEAYLDEKGVKWEFLGDVPTENFDVKKSLQNQARFEPLNQERVDEYTEDMKRGAQFPPVIAHGPVNKLVIASGNHRLHAAINANKPLPAYRVIGADATTITAITGEENAHHGGRTSQEERIAQALHLIDNGATIPAAAAALSLPKSVLNRASSKRSAERRFHDNKVSPITVEKLPETVKRRLADIHTDEGFTAAVDLAVRARLSSDEVFELVTAVNEIRSSAKQVEYIDAQAELYRERIQATAGGVLGSRRPHGPKARMQLALGTINNMPDTDAIVKAYRGPERDEAATKFRATARRLNELAKALTAASS